MSKPGAIKGIAMRSRKIQTDPIGKITKKNRGERGFTLLEVVAAISVLTFGLLGVASMQTTSMRVNFSADRLTEGTIWAQDKLEELMALPNTDSDLSDGSHGPQTVFSANNPYTLEWDVVDNVDPGSPVNNAKLITVRVTWQVRGVTKSTQLDCIRSQLF
jgi:prepilin-type N-terminal cleavage/methylation domain-containing protein